MEDEKWLSAGVGVGCYSPPSISKAKRKPIQAALKVVYEFFLQP
jgi:hypothetical protein